MELQFFFLFSWVLLVLKFLSWYLRGYKSIKWDYLILDFWLDIGLFIGVGNLESPLENLFSSYFPQLNDQEIMLPILFLIVLIFPGAYLYSKALLFKAIEKPFVWFYPFDHLFTWGGAFLISIWVLRLFDIGNL